MIRSRIAPTPSGYLHTGNAVDFVITALWVRKAQGSLRLRIDDSDTPRIRPEYIEDIFRTLEWLGLEWDEGPQTPDEHRMQYSQLLRRERYHEFIRKIIQSERVFACSCSRKYIGGQQYPGFCRNKKIPFDQPGTALRILTPENTTVTIDDMQSGKTEVNLYDTMRDFIIRRRDGIPSYQLSSLADDIDFGINLIIRGEDLLPSTAAQLFLSRFCGANDFAQTTFYHHPLLKDKQGQKLSKSAGSASLKAWREKSSQPKEFYHLLSKMLGWREPASSFEEMLAGAKEGLPLFLNKPGRN